MADDNDQDKTEDPTPRRREEAREEGQVARSQDLSAAVLLAGMLVLMWPLGPGLWSALEKVARQSLGAELGRVESTPGEAAWRLSAVALREVAAGLAPLLIAVVVIAVLVNAGQVGLRLSTKKLQPNPGVLNPISGFKKLFFESRTYFTFGLNVLKLLLVAAVAWWAVGGALPQIVGLQRLTPAQAVGAGGRVVFLVGIKVALALLVLSLLDYAYQKWKHEQDLKMTKQQVKEEMRRMEGDPQVKQRRRQLALQRAMGRLAADVPTADVVVTNPTHFAVAVKYDDDRMRAPRVVAKGGDLMAQRIREIAAANGVAIVERPPLARGLFAAVEVGHEIPEDFYGPVAEILAYVYRLDRELAAASK